MSRRATLLGTGTSTGVPIIGCTCVVCTSDDPRNRRLRTALRFDLEGAVLLVDTPPDLRQQALRFGLPRLDGVLFTHAHADHIFGLDELRAFSFRQREAIRCFGSPATMKTLRRVFSYAFEESSEGGGRPRLDFRSVDGPFEVAGEPVVPIPVFHGSLSVYGYRIGSFAYVTDCNRIPEESFALLDGVSTLVLGALRYRPHSTHFSLAEAVAVAERIGARRTLFTHLAHEVDHSDLAISLPAGKELGYDGLVLDFD